MKIEITPLILFDHWRINLDISNSRNRNGRQYTNPWKLNNTTTEWKLSKDRNEEGKIFLELNENKNTNIYPPGAWLVPSSTMNTSQ